MKFLEKRPKEFKYKDDLIIELNHHENSLENPDLNPNFVENPKKKPSKNYQKNNVSELGTKQIYGKNRPKIKKLGLLTKIPSQNFTPLLDSLRDSLDKSPFQSKISLHYEKSSLFKAAQTNFIMTTNDMSSSEDSDIYENIFSDGDISVKNSKKIGLFSPNTLNIINVNTFKTEK